MQPRGWYPDPNPGAPEGQVRFWDGAAWTDAVAADTASAAMTPTPPPSWPSASETVPPPSGPPSAATGAGNDNQAAIPSLPPTIAAGTGAGPRRALIVGAAVVALGIAGVVALVAGGTTADDTADVSATDPPTSSTGPVGTGSGSSPADPWPLNSETSLAGWTLRVTDAYVTAEANGYTAERGRLLVITVDGRNVSSQAGDLFLDLNWGTIDAGGQEWLVDCGVPLADDLAFAEPVGPGGRQAGSYCLDIPTDVAEAMTTFFLEDALGPDRTRVWFPVG